MRPPSSTSDFDDTADPAYPSSDVHSGSRDSDLAHDATVSLEKILENPEFQRKIAHFIRVYSVEVSAWEMSVSDERYSRYYERMMSCVRFHAGQLQNSVGRLTRASVNAMLVFLQEGHSAADRTSLGGNPLRDCVLASAMLCKTQGAVEYFQKQYYGYLQGIAFQVHAHFGNDPDEWWNEFLDFLAGYTHEKGKLATYQGKCALQYWLRVVLWNYLRRRPIYGSAYEFPEEIPMVGSNEEELSLQESVALFTKLIREALEALPEKYRLLLSMIYIDSLLKKDIAAVFQVHPGQITRWEEKGLRILRKEITKRLETLPRKDLHEEIIGGIVNKPEEFCEAMTKALKELRSLDETEDVSPE